MSLGIDFVVEFTQQLLLFLCSVENNEPSIYFVTQNIWTKKYNVVLSNKTHVTCRFSADVHVGEKHTNVTEIDR